MRTTQASLGNLARYSAVTACRITIKPSISAQSRSSSCDRLATLRHTTRTSDPNTSRSTLSLSYSFSAYSTVLTMAWASPPVTRRILEPIPIKCHRTAGLLRSGVTPTESAVILSEAKDLIPVASGDEVLRCAHDDRHGGRGRGNTRPPVLRATRPSPRPTL